MNFKNATFFLLLLLISSTRSNGSDLSAFYIALQSSDSAIINAELNALEKSNLKEKDAYMGALIIKKSNMEKSGLDKLSMFKKGRNLLEGSIKKDTLNAEYRFVRLTIQEHVPDFLNYHSKKTEDAKMIKLAFHKLPREVQEAIRDYSKTSHILKQEDFLK